MDGDKLFTTSFDKNGTWVWYVPGYSLLFDANGGYSTMGRQTGLEVEKNHTIDTKDRVVNRGYTLTGFTATVKGTDYTFPVQEDGTVVIRAEDNKDWDGLEVTLYAQWERNAGEPVMESREFVFDLQAGKTIQLMNLPGGAAYEVWEESTPGWTLQSFEKLNGTIASNVTIQAQATNEKTPNKVSYILRASKTMDGRPATANEFSFTLTETTGGIRHELFTRKTNAGGSVVFDAIVKEYDSDYWTDERKPEVYTYEIQEIDEGEPTIDYDPSVYIATVTVSKSGADLNAEVTYAKKGDEGNASAAPPTFANATWPGRLVIEKAAENPLYWTAKADAQLFTFDVMMTDSVGNPINGTFALKTEEDPVTVAETTITLTRGQGTVTLKKGQKATISGLPAGTLYTVTEREKPGFTATVADTTPGEATGAITAAQDSTATFMNSYAAKGVAVIKAKKALEGRDLAEGEFKFELLLRQEGQPDTRVDTAANAGDGTVLFKTLEYTQEGTYRYVIREVEKTDPAIDYSGQELAVTVVMTDLEGEGRLTPSVTITGGDGEQHDTITNSVLKGALKISKTVEPASARDGEAFTFTVTLRDASGNPLTGDYPAVRETGERITLPFGTAGVCTLTLAHGQSVTIPDLPGGATYAVEEAARAGYAVSSTGESGTIVGNSTAEASFTNTYSAKGSYTFKARKTLTGGELTAGQFRFMLEELNDEGEPTGKSWKAANGANGANDSVALATLDFTDADLGPDGTLTRRYRVTEINESAAGYVYDDTVYTVKLTVSDAAKDGALKFSAAFLDGDTQKEAAAFANSYSDRITMTAQKVWQDDGDVAQNTRRDVTLTLNRRVDNGAWTRVEGSERTIGASDTGDRLKVTWENLPRFDAGKIIEYQVVETMAGYTPQTNPYRSTVTGTEETGFTVTNRYVHTELTLEGRKTLSGLALSEAPEFHFVLMKDGAELETVTNDTDGKFRFSPLVYTLADLYGVDAEPDGTRSRTFNYTVSERNDGHPGYRYDPSVYSVTVTLTEDVNGVLSARIAGITKGNADAQKLEFANAYEAEGECTLAVRKALTGGEIAGRKLKDGEFTFNLYEAGDDGEPVGTPIQAKKNGNGSVTFEPITYTKEGTYRYVISEAEGSDDTIVYSKQQIYVTVEVSDPRRDGKLDAAATYADRNGAALTLLTNTVKPGSLVISKSVRAKGEMTEQAKNQRFAFEVTLTAGQKPWSGQKVIVGGETQITDAQGRLLVHAMGGKDVRISGIPAGIRYAIRETDLAEGWQQVDAKNTSNSIQANRTAEASFTNEFVNLIDVTAIKVWQGDEGNEQLRRDVELRLLRRAGTGEWEQLSAMTISKDAQTEAERKVTWATLPRFDKNGDAIEYRVDEAQTDTADGSSPYLCQVTGSMAEGFTVTNSFCRTTFTVYKQWRGEEGGPISLTLYADGERLDPQPVCRRVGNVYTYEDLMMYNRQGLPIVYSAKEAYMEGYLTIYCNKWPYDQESRMIYNGGTIVNREVVDVRVQKVWLGLSPEAEKPQITLTLLCNGEPVDRDTPVPDRNGWYCFTNLPVYTADGTRAEYTVVEAPMSSCVTTYTAPDGSPADCAKNGYTITNRCLPETGDTTHEAGWLALGMGAALGALLLALRRRRASPDDR